jgi:glycosyltransferase involved in cell wall biosynthesis
MGLVALRILVVAPAAMLTDHRPHGDGLVAFGFVRELAARGHELHVAAGRVDLRDGVPAGVHVHRLTEPGSPGKLARLRFMWRLRALHRELARSGPVDLVHQVTPVEVGVSLALADISAPVVLGPYVPDWPAAVAGAGHGASFAKRALRAAQQARATTVLLSTPAASSKLELRRSRRLHVHELPLGVDDRTWRPAARGHEPGQDVLFLASVELRKGIHVLLDAFARLAPELPGARLLVAGTGTELDNVRRRLASSPALDAVELLGRLDRPQAVAAMQAADVYCLPSFGDPNPLAVLEAMACALPVVTTDSGGLRHLVSDRGGRKVAPGDAMALAGALRELLGDPALRRQMGDHNRRVVEERYGWSAVVDRLEDLYAEAIRQAR